MVDPRFGWLDRWIQGVIVASVAGIVALGCASPQTPAGGASDEMAQTLEGVSVAREGEGSVVRLEGLVDPIYSVTSSDDGDVVVVELVGVSGPAATSLMGEMEKTQQVAAYDGVVDLVTISSFDDEGGETPLTRVEVVLAAAGEATVSSTGSALEIAIRPATAMESGETAFLDEDAELEEDLDEDVESMDSDVTPWSEELGFDAESGFDAAPVASSTVAPAPAATELSKVSTSRHGDGVLVSLEADGNIGSLEAFTLSNPARLVIDLPGLVMGPGAKTVEVGSALVERVRVGAHSGKVRIVVDGGAEAGEFEGRQVMPGATGVWVAIGEGAELADAMSAALAASESAWAARAPAGSSVADDEELEAFEALVAEDADAGDEMLTAGATFEEAPAAPAAMPAEPALPLAEVYGLHYERTEGMDRTAILSDDTIAYETSEPDATTLVVRIPNARISQEASDRIFPKTGGPVSLIHAFQQPEVDVPEVRVVFTRAPGQKPVISRRGSMLFVDFEDRGVAAAPPPAFPNAGGEASLASTMPTAESLATRSAPTSAEGAELAFATGGSMDAGGATGFGMAEEETFSTAPMGLDPAAAVAAMPAAADTAAVWTPPSAPAVPAAVEVPAAIEVLEEGGLIDGKEYRGRRVSLDFKDVAIADVLRLIAEVSDLNIIAGDEVSGKVTIRLVEVPWDQALDVILMTKGLGFVRVGNVLRIAPADVLKAEEEVRLQERRNKEKLEDLEVKLLPVNYASVKDTESLVKRLLSARGTVNLDERTNTLIIKDISSVIDEASALIAAIDTQTPQVMIEAKIVEANLDFSRELGSVWGVQTNQFVDPFNQTGLRQDLGSEDLTFVDQNSLAFANPITSVPTGLMTLGALILDQDFRVDAQIQAAESSGDGKVVSSPRIVTLDNREAKIEQGVSIPFQTFEGGDAKLEFVDAVLSLIVTPHITADESIIMEIEVTRNAPDDSVQTPTGSPAIAKNAAETETLVKDGQTLVLGGIYTIVKSQRQSRVPYLHRIPVIGNAFKNNEVTDNRKELLVFVTPRIVRLPEMARN
ncbi:MAG: type IV pilus secretin PilQ [Myxococcota bacterium]